MAKKKIWDWRFAPSYTPLEVLEAGSFEGGYIRAVEGIPKKYMQPEKVLKERNVFDESLNKFGTKSRQSKKEWAKKGWLTKDSPNGWFEWYIKYFEGRRLIGEGKEGDEDKWQIGRWSSFVSRHQGQIAANCKLGDDKCRSRQRQGLLQWGWNSGEKRTATQHKKNVRRMAKLAGCELEDGWESKVDALYSSFSKEALKIDFSQSW